AVEAEQGFARPAELTQKRRASQLSDHDASRLQSLGAAERPYPMMAPPLGGQLAVPPAPMPEAFPQALGLRDRLKGFETNPVRSAVEVPVATFSIVVETASYAFVRRALKEGVLADAQAVRVQAMINYFPY